MRVAGAAFLPIAVPDIRVARVATEVLVERGRRQIGLGAWSAGDDRITVLAVTTALDMPDNLRRNLVFHRLDILQSECGFQVNKI